MSNDNESNDAVRHIEQIRKSLVDGSKAMSKPDSGKDTNPSRTEVTGSNNVVGDGNVVVYGPPKIVRKVVVQTGNGTIDAKQKRQINDLIDDWMRIRGLVRKTSPEYRSFRSALNRYMGVNSYHEIPAQDFDRAVKWLRRQKQIVMSMPSAKRKVPDWRKRRYAAINARAKEFPHGLAAYRRFAKARFGTGSLRALSDDQLEAVYRHVFGWCK